MPLNEHETEGVKYFSGRITYQNTLKVDAADLEGKVWLDLGEVKNLARVWVNGAYAGTAWKTPFQLDVTGLLKPRGNELSLEVANTWKNRMFFDQKRPVKDRIALTHHVYEWFGPSDAQDTGELNRICG